MVALVLADHADEHGRSFPSVARMMRMSSMSDRTCQRSIQWLEDNGYLVREMRSGKSTVYRLTPDRVSPLPPTQCHPRQIDTPDTVSPYPRHSVTPTPDTVSPITINRTIKEPSFAQKGAFAEFWSIYPKRKSKADAEQAWLKLKPDAALTRTILNNLKLQMQSADWQKDGGQFVPYPATYIRKRRWEDESAHEAAESWAGAV